MSNLDPHAIEYSVSPGKNADARDNLVDDVKGAFPFDHVQFEKGGMVTFFYNEWIGEEEEMNLADCCKELGWTPENF